VRCGARSHSLAGARELSEIALRINASLKQEHREVRGLEHRRSGLHRAKARFSLGRGVVARGSDKQSLTLLSRRGLPQV